MEINGPTKLSPYSGPVYDVYAEPVAYDGESFDSDGPTAMVWQAFRVLRQQVWKILGFVFAVTAAALLYTLQLQPLYRATTLLELDNINQVMSYGNDLSGYSYRSESRVIQTQLKLIHSPEVAAEVIRDLRLANSPMFGSNPDEDASIPKSLSGLQASMVEGTYLIEISYVSPSPELCRDVANSVAKVFINQGFESRMHAAQDLQNRYEIRLEDLEARSELAQRRLLEYEAQHGITWSEGRTDLAEQELANLQNQLIDITAERTRSAAAFRSVNSGNVNDLLISAHGSTLVAAMARKAPLEQQAAELSATYGVNHPRRKLLQAQLDYVDSEIELTRQAVKGQLDAEYRGVQVQEESIRDLLLAKKAQVDRMARLAVEYGSLRRAAEATTTLYEELLRTVSHASLQGGIQPTTLRQQVPARLPGAPIFPDLSRNLILAFLTSTMIAATLALLAEYLDRTIRNTSQIEQWLRVPVLASLPRISGTKRPQSYLLQSTDGSSGQPSQDSQALTEGFTMLRTSLMLSAQETPLKLILVASAVPAEGKSTVAAGLAIALAQQNPPGKRVLLVDGDLRRPTVHATFQLDNQIGLASLLSNSSNIDEAIQAVPGTTGFDVLPRGPAATHPNELITGGMGGVLEKLRSRYEYVVIDSAPLLASADSMILATLVDGVVLVARAGGTSRDLVASAFRQVRRVRGHVLGLVLNQVKQQDSESYRYYYSYQHDHEGDAAA